MKRGHAAIRTSSPSGATADFFPGDIGRRQSPRTSTSAYASARNRDGSGVLGDLLTPTLSFLSGSLAAGAKLTAAAGAGAEGDGGGRVAASAAARRARGSYFDLDFVEAGTAKEVISPRLLKCACEAPSLGHAKIRAKSEWMVCDVKREKKKGLKCFRAYESGSKRFLFSAVISGGVGYISQHERFPEEFVPDRPNTQQCLDGRYCCRVQRNGASRTVIEIVSIACENCDNRICKYHCESAPSGDADERRQVLAYVEQSTSRIHEGVDVRALRVDIPRVHSDAWRTVWCPRCPRGSGLGRSGGPAPGAGHPAVATRAAVAVSARGAVLAARGAEGTDVSPPPARISGAHARVSPPLPTAAGGGGAVDDAISLATKLPWWNDSIASLSMKFMGHRVAAASSKNFLVEDRSRELGDHAVLQFGKMDDNVFSLECRGPLCLLQAFGVMVASFIWLPKIDAKG